MATASDSVEKKPSTYQLQLVIYGVGMFFENAEILKAVLLGKGTQTQQDVVALNTALALYVGEAVPETGDYFDTFAKAVVLAKDVLLLNPGNCTQLSGNLRPPVKVG